MNPFIRKFSNCRSFKITKTLDNLNHSLSSLVLINLLVDTRHTLKSVSSLSRHTPPCSNRETPRPTHH